MELHDILFTLKLYNLFLDSYLVKGLTPDLYGYHKTHPEFPEEPTSDQFLVVPTNQCRW